MKLSEIQALLKNIIICCPHCGHDDADPDVVIIDRHYGHTISEIKSVHIQDDGKIIKGMAPNSIAISLESGFSIENN